MDRYRIIYSSPRLSDDNPHRLVQPMATFVFDPPKLDAFSPAPVPPDKDSA